MLRATACLTLLYSLHLLAFAQAPVPAPVLNQKAEDIACGDASASRQFQMWIADFDGETGAVTINGVDARHPSTPFTWVWGDGSTTDGWFPQSHTYVDLKRDHLVQVNSHENDGSSDCMQLTLPLRAWESERDGRVSGPDAVHVQEAAPSPRDASPAAKPRPEKIRVGGKVTQANLVSALPPKYPEEARAAHVSGTVLFHAIIGKDGTIQRLEFVSGPPLLMTSAFDAVRQWRYKPTLLNGYPIEVDTTISVVYSTEGWIDPRPGTISSAQPVVPQREATQLAVPVDPQLKADIDRLFDLLDVKGDIREQRRSAAERSRATLFSNVLASGADRNKIVSAYIERYASLYSDSYANDLAALYAKYLTDDDVKQIIQFYETPAGQRFRAARRHMEVEEMQDGQSHNTDVKKSVIRQLCKEYPEFQAAEEDCVQAAIQKERPSTEPAEPK